MLIIDRDKLNVDKRQTPIHPELEKFATQVSYAKPLCKFVAGKGCIQNVIGEDGEYIPKILRLFLYQSGERIGEIFVSSQYKRGTFEREPVYAVQSFRITKNRGERDVTKSRDMKVALRIAKKMFSARAESEMRTLIDTKLTESLNTLCYYKKRELHRCIGVDQELDLYILKAYEARKGDKSTVVVPAHPVTVKNMQEHDKHCEDYLHMKSLVMMKTNKQGYGVKVMDDDSLTVLDYKSDLITRYASFDKLPENIQSKFAMFKVLKEDEPYAHIGCKFKDDMIYVAGDA
jgi:hypothetical protein